MGKGFLDMTSNPLSKGGKKRNTYLGFFQKLKTFSAKTSVRKMKNVYREIRIT